MIVGAIADDYTGGADVAVAFRREGLRALLLFGLPDEAEQVSGYDVLVIALKSRMTPAADAVAESLAAWRWLRANGADAFYFKFCSTFDSTPRGNIGPVLDALSDVTDATNVVMTPSSPEHGRTQYEGYLFVDDVLLSESPMQNHPLTPMTDSKLSRVLSAQTERKVAVIRHEDVRSGEFGAERAARRAVENGARYLLADAVDEGDLATIGTLSLGTPLTAGAAGLAGGLAAALAEKSGTTRRSVQHTPEQDELIKRGPAVVLAGSCSRRTLEQIDAMKEAGRPAFYLDAVANPDSQSLAAGALAWYDRQDPETAPLIHSSVTSDRLVEIQSALGVTRSAVILEEATGLIARGLVDRGVRKIVAAGGETSGAIVSALKIPGSVIGEEAARGVPWIITTGPHPLALLLKSGNFGEVGLLAEASRTSPSAVSERVVVS